MRVPELEKEDGQHKYPYLRLTDSKKYLDTLKDISVYKRRVLIFECYIVWQEGFMDSREHGIMFSFP